MSEDTTVKPGHRRRRTTRAGRRRAGRPGSDPPGEGGDASGERWSPALRASAASDPEALAGESVEELTDDDPERELEHDDDELAEAGAAAEAAADPEDSRKTAEIMITPLSLSQLDAEDEKTKPRIRVNDLFPDSHPIDDDEPREPVHIWSRPSSRSEPPPGSEQPGVAVAVLPAVVIAAEAKASVARQAKASEAGGGQEPPPRPEAAPPRSAPAAAPQASSKLAAPPAAQALPNAAGDAVAQAEPPRLDARAEVAEAKAPRAAEPALEEAAGEEPDASAPANAESAAPETVSFESFGDELADSAERGSDPEAPIVVEVSELEAQRRSRTPPPPPPDARAKSAAQKRPPPPPSSPALKPEDERARRKQVRKWWERFFSEDYLMSVIAPSPAQIAKQVDFIEQSLGVAKGSTILDVGCGLGLHSVELTRRGYLVVGLDLSLSMITRAAELAQEQQLKLNVVHADIREMEFDGAFDGVICMGTTFGFFDDDANRDVLARLYQALRPGGRLLLDTVNRDCVIRSQPNLVWYEGDECVCMEESDFNYFNSRLTVKRTMMREDGRQSQAEYSLRLYSLHELGQMMQQVGFRVIEVSGQEAIRGAFFGAHSPRVLMLAERRAPARLSTTGQFPVERGNGEGRASVAFPQERGSAEIPKIPRSD